MIDKEAREELKELRTLLSKTGIISIIRDVSGEYPDTLGYQKFTINEKLNAIIEYLGIDFEKVPNHTIAKRRRRQDDFLDLHSMWT